jgi:hypothetical protein
MPKIYSVADPFDLNNLTLGNPINKNGGHFIKFVAKDSPLYFQAPRCTVKQGFVVSGKKMFCDFIFSNEHDDFFSWLETLEEKTRAALFRNREKWFETALDEDDIESSLNSPYKMYKSGKYYVIRTNVPYTLGKCDLKIYDENERETDPEQIKENTHVLGIFEFKGIRCSVRSFQYEIELKQMLIVEPTDLFEKCIIKSRDTSVVSLDKSTPLVKDPLVKDPLVKDPLANESPVKDKIDPQFAIDQLHATETDEPLQDTLTEEDLPIDLGPSELDLYEVDLSLEALDNSPAVQLKPRNDVYYKMYKDAKEKAREAKQIAISNYLEAKRIKNTYLFDDNEDSDSDLDELSMITEDPIPK